jgi:rifampicin phosphotransferase
MRPTMLSQESTVPRWVFGLDDPATTDPDVAGTKGAALALARRAGIRVLDGFVISTDAAAAWRGADDPPAWLLDDLHRDWVRLTIEHPSVIVRSSSPIEDTSTSSMAGQFRSVLDVASWEELLEAVPKVIASSNGAPMAVLVQPFLQPACGGVLFGADPVTGRRDRLVVAAVPGGPDKLVSGAVTGTQFSLSTRGRLLEAPGPLPEGVSRRSRRKAFVRLAAATARLFDGPQDIEWALDSDGRLVLFQSRPISAVGEEAEAGGPVLGPGPLAETFPAPLATLEADLWVPPLRDGLRRALEIMGVVSPRKLRSSPVVVTIGGRPAVDLELVGLSPVRRRLLARLDPRPPARRLLAAWRIGRLRAALPTLATDVVSEVDAELRGVPALDTLSTDRLLGLLERSRAMLVSLHGYEVLAGQLLDSDTTAPTAMSRALRVLAEARSTDQSDAGGDAAVSDDELVARHPVLLSLVPPAIGRTPTLPQTLPRLDNRREAATEAMAGGRRGDTGAGPTELAATRREALRLRIRWLHELTARAAHTLGGELARRGSLLRAEAVRDLQLDELRRAVAGEEPGPIDPVPAHAASPLPRAFRLAGDVIVPLGTADRGQAGRGAGGGRGMGRVSIGPEPPPPRAVLVVPTLDPALAPLLPELSGLVAESGSVLSHLAILAREYGIPTVVDLPGATQRFAAGTWIVVDGSTGEVSTVESAEWAGA